MEVALLMCLFCLITIANILAAKTSKPWRKKFEDLTWKDLAIVKLALKQISPRDFEIFVAELFTIQHVEAVVTQQSGDGGKDVIIYHPDKSETFIECKLYDPEVNSTIGRPIAQKLIGACVHEEKMKSIKVNGMIFTTSTFTDECKEYCKDMGIQMVDMDGILDYCRQIGTSQVLLALDINPSYVIEDTLKHVEQPQE